ncbi:uncharacterized protein EV422DRAFT_568669 [Fimicolochytrium jonesii]|uniref:uncharacterized protein n=1 Tax=Fimicolochytrium jonesii TaxID=1396493 RepID=UPI0022FEB092|nr:uncharacterized protein EV422DRAFT_568669 [Fimicolochytrium jonesii]KAI8819707.1 hypothetical protein EV422DRAFT_568669 [Fimicolochytrium jonesii]
MIIAMLLTFAGIYMAVSNGRRRGWTSHNIIMVLAPVTLLVGQVIELWFCIDWYQLWGHPNFAHITKVFWFLGSTALTVVQRNRIEFILIATNRPRHWDKAIVGALVSHCLLFASTSMVAFLIGTTHGPQAVPFHYSIPIVLVFVLVGVVDTALSVATVNICANYDAMIRALGKSSSTSVSSRQVQKTARAIRFPAICQLIADGTFSCLYLIGASGQVGYTLSQMSVLGPPLQYLFLLFSLECLKRAQTHSGKNTASNYAQSLATASQTGDLLPSDGKDPAAAPLQPRLPIVRLS